MDLGRRIETELGVPSKLTFSQKFEQKESVPEVVNNKVQKVAHDQTIKEPAPIQTQNDSMSRTFESDKTVLPQ